MCTSVKKDREYVFPLGFYIVTVFLDQCSVFQGRKLSFSVSVIKQQVRVLRFTPNCVCTKQMMRR